MDNNKKSFSEGKKPSSSERKLHIDLSEALNPNAEDDDDIIELKDEVIVPPEKKETEIKLSDDFTGQTLSDEPDEEKVIDINALNKESREQQEVVELAEDFAFDEDDEEYEKILPFADEKSLKFEDDDEVTEITEFDDIISEDDTEMVTLAETAGGIEPEEEEEFLELIDIEEESIAETPAENELKEIESEIIQFDDPRADVEDVELDDFINESLDEEIRINDDLEDNLTSSLGIEVGSEVNLSEQTSDAEEFDFNLDSSEISKKIDQLDTIYFDETKAEDDFIEEAESEDEFSKEAEAENKLFEETESEDIFIEKTELDDEVIAGPPSEPVFVEEAEAEGKLFEETESEDIFIEKTELDDEVIAGPPSEPVFVEEAEAERKLFEETESEDVFIEKTELDDEVIAEPPSEPVFVEEAEADIDSERANEINGPTDDDTSEKSAPGVGIANLTENQIEASIQQVIEQNFSEKIESMIVAVIEKAVSKEIDRLKNSLLEDKSDDRA